MHLKGKKQCKNKNFILFRSRKIKVKQCVYTRFFIPWYAVKTFLTDENSRCIANIKECQTMSFGWSIICSRNMNRYDVQIPIHLHKMVTDKPSSDLSTYSPHNFMQWQSILIVLVWKRKMQINPSMRHFSLVLADFRIVVESRQECT